MSGCRHKALCGLADVSVAVSLGMAMVFMAIALAILARIFKTGYRLNT